MGICIWCYGLNCVLAENVYVEALAPNMIVFGDKIFKETIKIK